MGEQATLIDNANLGAGKVRRLETQPTEYHAPLRQKWSYATRIQPDKIPAGRADGSDLPIYRLFFPAQRNADDTMTHNEWWEFPRDLTLLQEAVDRDFPNGFQGKYRADIHWRVLWGKSGNSLFIREILPVEGPMQAPTELDEHLNANVDQTDKPAKQHETNPDKVPFAVSNHIKRETDITAGVGTFVAKLFPGGLDADKVRELGADSVWATVEKAVADYNAKRNAPAATPAPEAPPAGAADASAISLPVKAQNVTSAPPSPKNGQPKDNTVNTEPDTKEYIRAKYTKKLQGGKEYLEVQGRVLLFRLDHPDWSLETDLIGMTDDAAVFKCTIRNADGRTISTGHGRATAAGTKNLGSRFIEKAETAAIGRALSLASYGTDDTLEDSDYLADSPVAKAA